MGQTKGRSHSPLMPADRSLDDAPVVKRPLRRAKVRPFPADEQASILQPEVPAERTKAICLV